MQRQARFDDFIGLYDNDGPHQALGMSPPAELYTPSTRERRVPDEPEYPCHDRTGRAIRCGRVCIGRRKINLNVGVAGQTAGVREVSDQIRLASSMRFDLGLFDSDEDRVEPTDRPLPPGVLPMRPE